MNELNTDAARSSTVRTTGGSQTIQPAQPAAPRSESGKAAPVTGKALPPAATAAEPAPVETAVTTLNDYVQSQQRDLRFSLDSESGRPIVRVLDSSTEEVIRQIPSDVALRLARNVKDVMQEMRSAEAQPGSGAYGPRGSTVDLQLINTKV